MYKLLLKIGYKLAPVLGAILPFSFYRNIHRRLIAKGSGDDFKHMPFDRAAHPDGINMYASLLGGYSLVVSSETLVREIRYAGIRVNYHEYKQNITEQDPDETDDFHGAAAPYNINLVHAGPVVIHYDCESVIPSDVWDKRYNIFYFIWELELPSPGAEALVNIFDEFWVPSDYAGAALKKITDKPVITIPYAIETKTDPAADRKFFNLPEDKTLLLCMYDGGTDRERKNPDSVALAYRKAFPVEDDGVGIVFKIGGASEKTISKIKDDLKGYKNVYFIEERLTQERIYSLMKAVDIFISLPRAEGFGLMMAEAMNLGTPVITTGYSAHTEFMTKDSVCMVGWEYTPLTKQCSLYQPGAKWAEPDTDEAARHIKMLCENKTLRAEMSRNAKAALQEKLNPDKIAAQIQARVSAIYGGHE
jgi:glycosyltransferase involved in cell wall biosynthesis